VTGGPVTSDAFAELLARIEALEAQVSALNIRLNSADAMPQADA